MDEKVSKAKAVGGFFNDPIFWICAIAFIAALIVY